MKFTFIVMQGRKEKEQTILTFQRTEVKYRMSRAQYQGFMEHTKMLRAPDEAYPHSLILNIYYDTDHDELVTRSLDKPVYKEKLRVKAMGFPESGVRFLWN